MHESKTSSVCDVGRGFIHVAGGRACRASSRRCGRAFGNQFVCSQLRVCIRQLNCQIIAHTNQQLHRVKQTVNLTRFVSQLCFQFTLPKVVAHCATLITGLVFCHVSLRTRLISILIVKSIEYMSCWSQTLECVQRFGSTSFGKHEFISINTRHCTPLITIACN